MEERESKVHTFIERNTWSWRWNSARTETRSDLRRRETFDWIHRWRRRGFDWRRFNSFATIKPSFPISFFLLHIDILLGSRHTPSAAADDDNDEVVLIFRIKHWNTALLKLGFRVLEKIREIDVEFEFEIEIARRRNCAERVWTNMNDDDEPSSLFQLPDFSTSKIYGVWVSHFLMNSLTLVGCQWSFVTSIMALGRAGSRHDMVQH